MPISEAGQIYKIYINDSVLMLTGEYRDVARAQMLPDALQLRYYGKVKALHNVIDTLEKSPTPRQIVLTAPDVEKLFEQFKGLYRNINAAGGIVENKKGQILAIYRRKFWDLPKGKLDPGESFTQAAVREVLEETGIASVKLGPFVANTYHTFITRREKHRALKLTKWYRMTTKHTDLKWQVEEDIEDARWISPQKLLSGKYKLYGSIRFVLVEYLLD